MKLIFKFLLGFTLFVLVAFFFLSLFGKQLLSSQLTNLLGLKTSIGRLQVDVRESKLGLYDLRFKNLEGYDEKELARIPEFSITYDLSNLFSGEIRLNEARFAIEQVTLEKNKSGDWNLMEVISRGKPQKEPLRDEEELVSEKKKDSFFSVTIDKAVLSVGRGRYVDSSGKDAKIREFNVGIREEVFHNVTEPRALVEQVILKIFKQVGLQALSPDLAPLASVLSSQASKAWEDVRKGFSQLFN